MKLSLKESVRQTIDYAAFFDYDLTAEEACFWLISPLNVSLNRLPSKIFGLKSSLTRKRTIRRRHSHLKLLYAQKTAKLLSLIPTIELIAVTGSLAMDNAKKADDIDLMIVTKPDTLWLTRLFVVPLIRIFFKSRLPKGPTPVSHRSKGLTLEGGRKAGPTMKSVEGQTLTNTSDAICLNLWLDTSALVLPRQKRSLYTAHEVLQVKPILNRHLTYERFITANSWTQKHLANAYRSITANFPLGFRGPTFEGKKSRTSKVLSFFNRLVFRLQYFYMKSKMTRESVSLNSAFFHPRSLSQTLDSYLAKTI